MEKPPFEETVRWSRPQQCRGCHYPMARGLELCPACHKPARLFSSLAGRLLWQRLGETAAGAWGVAQILLLLLAVLTVAYYLSPLLMLFPLVALSADPPASRGGKTIVAGRRR
jgi:hypothetical protein